MDLKKITSSFVASVILVINRVFYLVSLPYKTMRQISLEDDYQQIGIIFSFVYIYFQAANIIPTLDHKPYIQFTIVLCNYLATVIFFYIGQRLFNKKQPIRPFFFLFEYALIPTIIWFYFNSILHVLIPPPRTTSTLGQLFSIVFVTVSISLLLWKIILLYLAIRFATQLKFFPIMLLMSMYIMIVCVYAICMYTLGFFRIPFI